MSKEARRERAFAYVAAKTWASTQHRQAVHFVGPGLTAPLYELHARKPLTKLERVAIRTRIREAENQSALSLTTSQFWRKPSRAPKTVRVVGLLAEHPWADTETAQRFKWAFQSFVRAIHRAAMHTPWTLAERKRIRAALRDLTNSEPLSLTARR